MKTIRRVFEAAKAIGVAWMHRRRAADRAAGNAYRIAMNGCRL